MKFPASAKLAASAFFPIIVMLFFDSCSYPVDKRKIEVAYLVPDQSVISVEGDTINVREFTAGRSGILSFISPACEHCQYQTHALLSDHEQKPEGLRLVFLADVHLDSLRIFTRQFVYDTIMTKFIVDEAGQLAQQMGVTSYPTMFLYDTAGVHLQTIVGEAKPGYVYKFFHDAE